MPRGRAPHVLSALRCSCPHAGHLLGWVGGGGGSVCADWRAAGASRTRLCCSPHIPLPAMVMRRLVCCCWTLDASVPVFRWHWWRLHAGPPRADAPSLERTPVRNHRFYATRGTSAPPKVWLAPTSTACALAAALPPARGCSSNAWGRKCMRCGQRSTQEIDHSLAARLAGPPAHWRQEFLARTGPHISSCVPPLR
jgi:hypothetical protein